MCFDSAVEKRRHQNYKSYRHVTQKFVGVGGWGGGGGGGSGRELIGARGLGFEPYCGQLCL